MRQMGQHLSLHTYQPQPHQTYQVVLYLSTHAGSFWGGAFRLVVLHTALLYT
jgi:hypothetical protein